jgi:hypothetical protein
MASLDIRRRLSCLVYCDRRLFTPQKRQRTLTEFCECISALSMIDEEGVELPLDLL